MTHRHFCDYAGHEWDCEGAAVRPFLGDTEPSVCMCIRHRVPMEEGDHSECSIELIACPDHREEQLRKIKENRTIPNAEEMNASEGWDDLFRPMTPEEALKFEVKHRFMDEVVFVGLKNLNTGFDAAGIHHFSPAGFGEVIKRCEPLCVSPIGIEMFTTDGGFVDCQIRPENLSLDETYAWARQLVEEYLETPEITMTATFDVPDSLLES